MTYGVLANAMVSTSKSTNQPGSLLYQYQGFKSTNRPTWPIRRSYKFINIRGKRPSDENSSLVKLVKISLTNRIKSSIARLQQRYNKAITTENISLILQNGKCLTVFWDVLINITTDKKKDI